MVFLCLSNILALALALFLARSLFLLSHLPSFFPLPSLSLCSVLLTLVGYNVTYIVELLQSFSTASHTASSSSSHLLHATSPPPLSSVSHGNAISDTEGTGTHARGLVLTRERTRERLSTRAGARAIVTSSGMEMFYQTA